MAVAAWLDERANATGLRYPAVAAARVRGRLSGDPEEGLRWFDVALEACGPPAGFQFERARVWLCQGELLRRTGRRPAAARDPLHLALAAFDRLGARPWSRRAAAELAAAGGGPSTQPQLVPLQRLTPQELQVARAASRGLSTLEVAAALFLSPKTVEAHLTRTYRKLGIRSRAALARSLTDAGLDD